MVVLPCVYAPSVAYMSLLLDSSTQIEAHEYYEKQTYRNRCAIIGAEGIMTLSIPILSGASQLCPIQSVQIAEHDNWRHKHWLTIQSCYGSSPYYEYYAPDLAPLYLDKSMQHRSLYMHNQQLIIRICQLIHHPYHWQETEQYVGITTLHLAELLHPNQSLLTPVGCVSYYQVFAHELGFIGNPSVFDLLFNMGPEALIVLQNMYERISQSWELI